jgi:hypothetical protein
MLENLIVGLIVAVAAWYAAKRLLPASLRARLFGKRAADKGDCDSGCGSCGGCEPAPPLDLDSKLSSTKGAQDGNASGGDQAMRRVIRLQPVPVR